MVKFPSRAGISLLEVLISILVLTVGLVGMAVLLTTGHRELVEAAKYDHAAGLGRACFRDLEVRGYLRPTWWMQWNAGNYVPLDTAQPVQELCVVDPLACSYAVATGLQAPASLPLPKDAPGGAVLIPRYSMRAWSGANKPMPYNQAERLCRSADDMVFNRPDDPQARPAMSFSTNNNNQPMNAQFNGDYSFFYVISPSPSEVVNGQTGYFHDIDNTVHPSMHARQFKVSCVVCYKRDLGLTLNPPKDPPSERMLSVMGPSGIGGGELRLLKGSNSGTWLDVRPGQWLMLVGNHGTHPVASWFRITSVGDPMDANGKRVEITDQNLNYRTVTVHGGDWNPDPAVISNVGAVLMDSVVGVFEKTITLDGSSRWSQ